MAVLASPTPVAKTVAGVTVLKSLSFVIPRNFYTVHIGDGLPPIPPANQTRGYAFYSS